MPAACWSSEMLTGPPMLSLPLADSTNVALPNPWNAFTFAYAGQALAVVGALSSTANAQVVITGPMAQRRRQKASVILPPTQQGLLPVSLPSSGTGVTLSGVLLPPS